MRTTVGRLKRLVEAALLTESLSRHCGFWKASDGKWYMDLAPEEYGEWADSDTYGPFSSQDSALDYLNRNFANPGSFYVDESGNAPPPAGSPNGGPVIPPRRSYW